MPVSHAVEDLAALLRELKDRTGRSYESLAGRANISRSALHRYCSGAAVPTEFEPLSRLGRACGASRAELLELHRRWAVASAAVADNTTTNSAAPTTVATISQGAAAQPEAGVGPADAGEPAAGAPPAADAPPGPVEPGPEQSASEAATARGARRPARRVMVGVVVVALLGVTALVAALSAPGGGGSAAGAAKTKLHSGCGEKIFMGQNDDCVREVQRLLQARGTKIGVDGSFGPETLRRVTAFQMLAGLPPNGVVDEATKTALYAGTVSMTTWPKDRVEARIRQVFREDPQNAVRVAQCASLLDPHYVLPNTNGSRNWGVFQLSDSTLARHNGTRLQAFDPEWNIATAYAEWREHRDFRDWVHCDPTTAAASSSASPAPGARRSVEPSKPPASLVGQPVSAG